jgi:hypothetical protein
VSDDGVFEDDDLIDADDLPVRRLDEMLPILLRPLRAGAGPRRLQRIDAAELDLRRCLEVYAHRLLTTPELAFLEFEQAVNPADAVARAASVDVLLLVLPFFIREPEWHGVDLEDRRLRIRISDVLAHQMPRLPELQGYSCGAEVWSVEYAVEDARRELRMERRAGR